MGYGAVCLDPSLADCGPIDPGRIRSSCVATAALVEGGLEHV
jgi:hypothetical protein